MEDRFLTFDGLKVHYRIGGTGPVIILMHGWGCEAATLASIEATALAAGYRVVNIDFPGFGRSNEPAEVWGVERYTDVIEALVTAERIDRPSLLGHSFGGRVAIVYGARHAEDVDRIILVDAAGVKPGRSMKYYWKVYTYKALRHLLPLLIGKRAAQARIDRIRARRGSSDYNQASPRMRAILSRVVNEDLCHLMPSIKAQTLLIWGEDDTATPLADAKKMNTLIHNSGLVSFPGCGHYSFLDNPRQFAAVLTSFLHS